MNELRYELDRIIYQSLLNVLETAYNILGTLPSKIEENSKITHKDSKELLMNNRRNSLLMNCDVKPETSRKSFMKLYMN